MSPPGWPLWAEQTSSAGWLEMPTLWAQLSQHWKLSHLLFLYSTECIPARGALWDDATQSLNRWTKASAISFPRCLPQRKSHPLPTPKPCPFPNQHLPKPLRSLSSWASLQRQFIEHHLHCFMPVPRAHVFGAYSAHFLASSCESGWTQMRDCPQTAQGPGPASLHEYMVLSNYSWKDIFDPSKATVERKEKSANINWGQEPGLWGQGSILQRLGSFTAQRWKFYSSEATNLSGP